MDKIIAKSIQLNCSVEKAFQMFTENQLLESWLCLKADVEPVLGGKYELFWNPEDKENNSTIGCRITSIEKNKMLSFEWKGAEQFKHFMNQTDPLTHVVVMFFSEQQSTATVYLIHSGWRNTKEWEEARQWFDQAWQQAFAALKKETTH
ncbi:MAG: SRPBCC domain-containing protein [Spirochaetes bacterium]|nr:SRPBCC domain-containing protein [Spirochaetota bacterium]